MENLKNFVKFPTAMGKNVFYKKKYKSDNSVIERIKLNFWNILQIL